MQTLRSMRVTTFPIDAEEESFVSQIVNYDRLGNEIARYEYKGPNEFESKAEFKFNEASRILEETTWQDDLEILERKTFIRNEKGEVDKIDIEYGDGSMAFQIVERNENENSENWIEQDEDDELESREFIKFDSTGRVILRESYDFNDKLKEVHEYEYLADGNMKFMRQFDERRKLIVETEFRYNDTGLLILRANRNRKGKLSDFLKIDYNEKGRPVKQSFSGKFTFLFEYDENGNTVVEEQYMGETQLDNRITCEYNADNRVVLEEQMKFSRRFEYEYYE